MSVAAQAPPAASDGVAAKPFAESFERVELKNLTRRVAKLPKESPDMPRNLERLRGPQYPFKTLTSGRDSLCGVGHSGNLSCFSGSLDGKSEIGWTSVAVGDGFAIGVAGGFALGVTGDAPVKLASGTPAGGDAGADAAVAGGAPGLSRDAQFRAVGAGGAHACAVEQGGAVQCWSKDATCELKPPEGLKATQVAVGSGCFACAIVSDGMRCWGGKAPAQEAKGKFSQLVAGSDFVCGLDGEKPVCSGREAPKSARRIVAAGDRLCWLDSDGAVGCDKSRPALEGKFVDLAITEKWACGADETGFWTCDGIKVPEFDYWKAHPSWAPTAEGRKATQAARKALLEEFAARFKTVQAPIDFQPDTKIDVGPFVETKFLPLLQNVGLDWALESERRDHRYGAQIQGLQGGTYLLLIREFQLELFAFDESAELKGKTLVAQRGPFDHAFLNGRLTFDEPLTHRQNVAEELVTSSLDTRGILKVSGQRTRESHEYEPIQKKDVYQCTVYDAKLTLNVSGKSISKTPLGWKSKKNEVGNPKGCDASWPLNVPFFIQDDSKRLDSPAWPKFKSDKPFD